MIKRAPIVAVAGMVALLALSAGIAVGQGDDGTAAKALLHDAGGALVGVAKLTESDGAVRVRVEVEGLPAGFHGFHVHAIGVCTPPFTSAGGHFNPGGAGHPGHAGDMPVLLVNGDGSAEARFATDRYGVADVLGRALIIHLNPDNYANIPLRYAAGGPDATTLATGDAGGRIACGVIERGNGD